MNRIEKLKKDRFFEEKSAKVQIFTKCKKLQKGKKKTNQNCGLAFVGFGLRSEENNLTKAMNGKSDFRSGSQDQSERRSPVQEFELVFLQAHVT